MSVNYIEKTYRLHKQISEQGFALKKVDNVWTSSDDVAVQSIIDSYDPLPEAKADARQRVKLEESKRVNQLFSFIDPEKDEAIDFVNFVIDIYNLIVPQARAALPQSFVDLQAIRTTALAKIAEVNALTDWQLADSYDASIGW